MPKPGRNDPCPCGSGKKYKQCCQLARVVRLGSHAGADQGLVHELQLAIRHHEAGHLVEAESGYRSILKNHPGHPDALHLLGVVNYQCGRHEQAIALIGEAIQANNRNALYFSNLGLALHANGRIDEALTQFDQALAINPDVAGIYNNKGNALRDAGRLHAAVECYQQALYRSPAYAEAHYNLGVAMQELNQEDAAAGRYRKAIELKPGYVEAHSNLGSVLQNQGDHDGAGSCFRRALSLRPDHAEALAGLAQQEISFGRFEEASQLIARALDAKPQYSNAWSLLAQTRKMSLDDGDWLHTAQRMLDRSDPPLTPRERINLLFAVGKYHDDTRQFEDAFRAFHEANHLKRQLEGQFDRVAFSQLVDALIARFTKPFMEQFRIESISSDMPVLIVGMPRSGTSLIEQIIASHPLACGAGEQRFWNQEARKIRSAILAGNLAPDYMAGAAESYTRALRQVCGDAARIVDKMPGNFQWLGLIHSACPGAHIVHTRRHPVDTCLSIFFQNFGASHTYGTDLGDLAFYYREYTRLMDHWRSVLPANRFLEISYEDLVADPERRSRQVMDIIGLEWDERCLDFHRTERSVITASHWQVRQKIYRTSMARWRNYEPFLGPLRELLEAQ